MRPWDAAAVAMKGASAFYPRGRACRCAHPPDDVALRTPLEFAAFPTVCCAKTYGVSFADAQGGEAFALTKLSLRCAGQPPPMQTSRISSSQFAAEHSAEAPRRCSGVRLT